MKQIRYLIPINLYLVTTEKQSNGELIESTEEVGTYYCMTTELSSNVDAQVYGADINNMLRLSSVRYKLEKYLSNLMNFSSDNISKYRVVVGNRLYTIRAVKERWVDCQYVGAYV